MSGNSTVRGFTLIELLVSISILMLISTVTIFSLQRTQQKDELNTAMRLLASDIKNIQAESLAAHNILTCDVASNVKRVCEPGAVSLQPCIDACSAAPAPHLGVSFVTSQDSYTLFADVTVPDWRSSGPNEVLLQRNLNPLNSGHVIVSSLKTNIGPLSTANIGVGRQNGTMRIEACGDTGLPACNPTEPNVLTITLQHVVTGDTATVEVNAVTGRVSFSTP